MDHSGRIADEWKYLGDKQKIANKYNSISLVNITFLDPKIQKKWEEMDSDAKKSIIRNLLKAIAFGCQYGEMNDRLHVNEVKANER